MSLRIVIHFIRCQVFVTFWVNFNKWWPSHAWQKLKAHPNVDFADLSLLAEVVASRTKCAGPQLVVSSTQSTQMRGERTSGADRHGGDCPIRLVDERFCWSVDSDIEEYNRFIRMGSRKHYGCLIQSFVDFTHSESYLQSQVFLLEMTCIIPEWRVV